MLATDVPHIHDDQAFNKILADNENVMICCGRNGPMCLPVYDVMETIQDDYEGVAFRVIEFDAPVAHNIRRIPQVRGFMGLPFTLYFKNGQVVKATSSVQYKAQVTGILDEHLV